jgi:hypothetical protein
MFCPHCGVPSDDGAIFCKNCGVTLSPNAVLTQVHEPPQSSVLQVRPWVRYWARMFDITAYTIVVTLAIGVLFPKVFSEEGNDFAFGFLTLLSWIFVESFLLSVFGTTPGKAFFKIRLSVEDGGSIPFIFAFYRSLRVWWRGLGAGVPFVAVFTLWHAETVLSRDGITSWDRELGFRVSHEHVGSARTVTAVIWFTIWFGLSIAGTLMEVP